jgi:hypothetical protein
MVTSDMSDRYAPVRTRTIEQVLLGDEHFEVSDRPAITYDFRSATDGSRDKLARAIAADPSVEWPVIETA